MYEDENACRIQCVRGKVLTGIVNLSCVLGGKEIELMFFFFLPDTLYIYAPNDTALEDLFFAALTGRLIFKDDSNLGRKFLLSAMTNEMCEEGKIVSTLNPEATLNCDGACFFRFFSLPRARFRGKYILTFIFRLPECH